MIPTRRWRPSGQRLTALLLLGAAACRQADPAPLTITQLTATPAALTVGRPVTLRWASTGATTCTLTTGARTLEPDCNGGSVLETYDAPGSYRVRFTVAADGISTIKTARVTVAADETTGEAAFDTKSDGLSVTFDAAPADAPEGSSFAWTFGDGARGAGERVTHRYARAGRYVVTLTLRGDAGERQGRRTIEVEGEVAGERVTLFGGDEGDLSAWERARGGAANWRVEDGFFEVTPGARVGDNDLRTKEAFGDFRLHLEFRVPDSPADTPEQARGNSGVYLQGRYEVQILDSYGRTLSGQNDAGAVYEVADAAVNASRPAGVWQSYDITFRAARFSGGEKTEDARVSVFWNGRRVHDETRVPGPTRLGEAETGDTDGFTGVLTGPILLQDHGDRVRYRNVWLEPL